LLSAAGDVGIEALALKPSGQKVSGENLRREEGDSRNPHGRDPRQPAENRRRQKAHGDSSHGEAFPAPFPIVDR
jgi:hypothetical protein